jgi:hypothetical protein
LALANRRDQTLFHPALAPKAKAVVKQKAINAFATIPNLSSNNIFIVKPNSGLKPRP